jgi:hypothetical protein
VRGVVFRVWKHRRRRVDSGGEWVWMLSGGWSCAEKWWNKVEVRKKKCTANVNLGMVPAPNQGGFSPSVSGPCLTVIRCL